MTEPCTRDFTDLICEKAYWYQSKLQAEKRLKRLRAERDRSGFRHMEFASVDPMFQADVRNAENDVNSCVKTIESLNQRIGTSFAHVGRAQPATAQQGKSAEVDSATISPVEAGAGEELQKLRDHFETELDTLKSQYEQRLETETRALKKQLDDMLQKHLELETQQDQLERKHDGGLAAVNLRVTALDHSVNQIREDFKNASQASESPKPSLWKLPSKPDVEDQDAKIVPDPGQLDTALQEVKSIQSRFSSNLSSLEELPKALETVQQLSEKMSALDGLSEHLPVIKQLRALPLKELAAKLPALKKLLNKFSVIEGLSDKLPAFEQLLSKPTNLKELSNKLPAIEELLGKTKTFEEMLTKMPLIEELSKKAPDLDELLGKMPELEQLLELLQSTANPLQFLRDQSPILDQILSKSDMYEDVLKKLPFLEELSDRLPTENSAILGRESDKVQAQLEEFSSKLRDAEERLDKLSALRPTREEDADLTDLTNHLPTLKALAGDAPYFHEIRENVAKLQQWQAEMEAGRYLDSRRSAGEGSNAPPSMGEAEVRKAVMPLLRTMDEKLVDNFQNRLHGVAEKLGGFLTEERKGRGEMEQRVKDVEDKVQGVDVRVSMLDKTMVEKLGTPNAVEQTVELMKKDVARFGEQVATQKQGLGHLDSNLAQAKHDFFSAVHTLQFQIMHLDSWASNFTSKQMYSEIVEQIASTMPTGSATVSASTLDQLKTLSERVESLEERKDESAMKKRKLINGSASAVSDSR